MKYFCYQGNDSDCGFAALKMLLAHLNHCKSYLYLSKGYKKKDFTFYDLREIASQHGVTLKAYKYSTKEVNELPMCLAMINTNHLVLVKSCRNGVYTIYDPSVGVYKLKSSKFDAIWTGETLEVESYEEKSLEIKKREIMPKRFAVISTVISLVAVVSLLAGFFFVKDDSYIFLPIIFISLFTICELVENWYLIKAIDYFDKHYIPIFFQDKKSDIQASYKSYIEFKKDYFSFARNFSSAMIVCSLILVVLIINDPLNSIICMGIVMLLLLEKLLFKKRDDETVASLSHNEDLLLNSDNDNLVGDILSLNESANGFALRFSVRKCVNTFIIMIFAFTMMILSQNLSVNYVLFHFGAFYLFLQNIDSIITMGEKKKDYELAKARFLDTCNL